MRPSTLQPRVVAGIALMLVATVAGAFVMQRSAARVTVWQVERDLAAATRLAPGDVHLAEVAVEEASRVYLPADVPVVGRTVAHDLSAGELLPRTALVRSAAPARLVTLPVEPLHLPLMLDRGQRVDVWLTPTGTDGSVGASRLVIARALVFTVQAADASGRTGVVLAVPDSRVAVLVSALRVGSIDLVGSAS